MEKSTRIIRLLMAAAALALAPAMAQAEGASEPFASAPVAGRLSPPMALGHRPDPKPAAAVELSTARTSVAGQCRRWQALASRLGETYAGHRLRATVLERLCGHEMGGGDEIWSWPWSDIEQGPTLPPRLHRWFGAWEIRCDTAGERRRCALIHRVPAEQRIDSDDTTVTAHFVIDMVAGRETVLWRLFVPRAPGTSDGGMVTSAALDLSPAPRAVEPGGVRYRVGGVEHSERFPVCSAAGCFMEAALPRGSTVASRLWDGRGLELEIMIGGAGHAALTLPARGFRAAFQELQRLRREETRGHRR